MDALQAYTLIGRHIEQQPNWAAEVVKELSPDARRWVARGSALVDATAGPLDMADFRMAASHANWPHQRPRAINEMLSVLEKVMASYELVLPVSDQGAFIQAGAAFDAFAAVARVLELAQQDVLVIDPYADHSLLTEFLPLARQGVRLRVLRDAALPQYGAKVAAAFPRWVAQYGELRPLEIRSTPPKQLHDRLIILDGVAAYTLSQSFKDLAARSPASLIRADAEISALKAAAYEEIWQNAAPL